MQLSNLAQELPLLVKFTSTIDSSNMLIILFLFEVHGTKLAKESSQNPTGTQRSINIEVLP